MNQALETFLQSSDPIEVMNSAVSLSAIRNAEHVPALIAALNDPLEDRRWGAIYALGAQSHDVSAIAALTEVLLNKEEPSRLRGQAAEHLAYGKSLGPLVECSADPSPNVRFWCVFALRSYRRARNQKARRAAVRALKARLNDHALPEVAPMGWSVGLEALAVLRSSDPCYPATRNFRHKIVHTLQDPLSHPESWQWTTEYWETLRSEPCMRGLFDLAVQHIASAGFDPVTFGR